jgi:hypothetical protein
MTDWKIRDLFEIRRTKFSKFYHLSERLAVDEIIVKFKGSVLFMQCVPKKRRLFGIKMSQWTVTWTQCQIAARGVTQTVLFKCVKWCFVLTEVVLKITTQKNNIQDIFSFILHGNGCSLDQNISKRTWIFTDFFTNICSPLRNKDITSF